MSSKELSKKRFSRFADHYRTSPTHASGSDLELLIEIARPEANWLVLEVATGGGHTAVKFAPYVAGVIASDIAPAMLEAAARSAEDNGLSNIRFLAADAESLPFEPGLFDLVTCRIAPHHFPDASQFIWHSARVIRPGGLLLVQDHLLPPDRRAAAYVETFERLRDPSHHRAFNLAEWLSMFQAAELEIECAIQILKRHGFYEWTSRQENDDGTVSELLNLLRRAPPTVSAWLQPRSLDTRAATFVNHHILLAGRKP